MPHLVRHSPVGGGLELNAVDAVHTVKIGADTTDDLYELFEIDAPRGHAVPPHTHGWLEAYYVLHGRMSALVGEDEYDLAPGSSLTVPPLAVHTFTTLTPSAKFLVFTLGAQMGRFFADLDRSVPTTQPIEAVLPMALKVADRHGVTFVRHLSAR